MKTIRYIFAVIVAIIMVSLANDVMAGTLKVPASMNTIESEAFMGDKSLDIVVLSDGLKRIESKAFANCGLSLVVFPNYSDTVAYIANDAFIGNNSLSMIVQPGTDAYSWANSKGFISSDYKIYWPLSTHTLSTSEACELPVYFLYPEAYENGFTELGLDIDGEFVVWSPIDENGYCCPVWDIQAGKLSVGNHDVQVWISDDGQVNKTYIDSTTIKVTQGKEVKVDVSINSDEIVLLNNQSIELPYSITTTNSPIRRVDIWTFGEEYVQLVYKYMAYNKWYSYNDVLTLSYNQFSVEGDYTIYVDIEAVNGTSQRITIPLHVGEISIPAAPTNVELITNGNTITVSWDPVDNAQSYRVYYGTTSTFSKATEIDLTGFAYPTIFSEKVYTITGLDYSKKYYIWVKAANSAGLSDASAVKSITTESDKPVISSITSAGNSLHVVWNEIFGADGYQLTYSTSVVFSSATMVDVSGGDVTEAVITDLDYNKTYFVKVAAVLGSGIGTASAYKSCKTEAELKLSTVADQTVSDGSYVTFSVTATGGTGSYSYKWYSSKTSSGSGSTVLSTSNDYGFYASSELSGYYIYCIVTSGSQSVTSNKALLTVTESIDPIPEAPTIQELTTSGNTITVSWLPVDNATYYLVYYGTSSTFSNATEINLYGHAYHTIGQYRSYTIQNLEYSTKYYVWLKAANSSGISGTSARKYITTEIEPDVLTIIEHPISQSVNDGDSVTMTVTATGGTGSYAYQWYRASSMTAAGTKVSTSRNYTFTASSTYDGYYYYCVVTCGSDSVTSNRAKLTIITEPEPYGEFEDSSITITQGNTTTFTVSGGVTNSTNFVYTVNGTRPDGSELGITSWSGITVTGKSTFSKTFTIDATSNGEFYSVGTYTLNLWVREAESSIGTKVDSIKVYVEAGVTNPVFTGEFTESSHTITLGDSWIVEATVSVSGGTGYLGVVTINSPDVSGGTLTDNFKDHQISEVSTQYWGAYTIDTTVSPWNIPGTYRLRLWAKDSNGAGGTAVIDTMYITIAEPLKDTLIINTSATLSSKLESIEQHFPSGYYWNHDVSGSTITQVTVKYGSTSYTTTISDTQCPSGHHSINGGTEGATCNLWGDETQCVGFARFLAWMVSGKVVAYEGGWSTDSTYLNSIEAGDLIWITSSSSYGHKIFVTNVSGDTIYYVDCNGDNHCKIQWGRSLALSTIKSRFKRILRYSDYK